MKKLAVNSKSNHGSAIVIMDSLKMREDFVDNFNQIKSDYVKNRKSFVETTSVSSGSIAMGTSKFDSLAENLDVKNWKVTSAPCNQNIIWKNFHNSDVVLNKFKAVSVNILTFIIAVTCASPIFVI